MSLKTIKNFVFDYGKKLGEGATGTVYLGTDLRNNQPVAVKAIDLRNIDNQVTQYLLKNEIKALKTTNHPNVLKAIDVIQEPEFVYIVTEYLPRGNLAEYINKLGVIPEADALVLFKQIVDGYDHIFDLQIYHRDLKPHNILFDSNFRPVLSDFGYCQNTGYLPKPTLQYNVGSPGFMAPESIVGNLYSQNSQVWSLGSILYEMMTGRNYTNGKPVMEAVMMIKKQGPYYPENSSPFARMLIKECMMLRPENRMKVKKLKELLHEHVKGKKVAAHAPANNSVVDLPQSLTSVQPPSVDQKGPILNANPYSEPLPDVNLLPNPFNLAHQRHNLPVIQGVTQEKLVTISKLNDTLPQQKSDIADQPNNIPFSEKKNDRVLKSPEEIRRNHRSNTVDISDFNVNNESGTIIKNLNPRKKSEGRPSLRAGDQDGKFSISQPSPIKTLLEKQNANQPQANASAQDEINSHMNQIMESSNIPRQHVQENITHNLNGEVYETMNNQNPFRQAANIQHEQTVSAERGSEIISVISAEAIPNRVVSEMDPQKSELHKQIEQQQLFIQQQAFQQQTLQQQLIHQNQLIAAQQQALQLQSHQAQFQLNPLLQPQLVIDPRMQSSFTNYNPLNLSNFSIQPLNPNLIAQPQLAHQQIMGPQMFSSITSSYRRQHEQILNAPPHLQQQYLQFNQQPQQVIFGGVGVPNMNYYGY